jgi:zinc protease
VEIDSFTLENGLKFSANVSKDIDSIALSGSVRAGAVYDEEGKSGTAEIVSRLLTRGTKKDPSALGVPRRIEEIGAALQFTNDDERIRFTAKCHSSAIHELMKIIAECLTGPSFSEDQIELTKAEIISDLEGELDDTRTRAHRLLMGLIYGEGKPFGRNPMGKLSDIKAISAVDIKEFYVNYYVPSSTLIAATGNFDFSLLASEIDSSLGKWDMLSPQQQHHRTEFPNLPESEGKVGMSRIDPMEYKSQVDIAMGMRTVPRKSEHYYPLFLGNLLLGQIGLYGRLGKNVREEKGVAYYSFSSLIAKSECGHIAIYAGVNPKNIVTAIEGITEEISRIQFEEIGEEELLTGKRNALGSLAISLDNSSERVGIIHEIEYYSLGGSKYFGQHENKINGTTSDQILKEFAEYANPSRISMTVVGPIRDANQIRLPNEILQKEA